MSIFSKIKNAIFGKKEEAPKPAPKAIPMETTAAPVAPAAPVAISEVDVAAQLDAMPGADKLNWRTSVVDLMKLVGMDASFAERKELAQELGDADYSGKAEENIWLHKKVLSELAANGGKVPADLLD
jgi:hypothetical protein